MIRRNFHERLKNVQAADTASTSDSERIVLGDVKEEFRKHLETKRISTPKSMCQAEYDGNSKIIVKKFAGKLIKNMGRFVNRERLLYPEEALFLMEAAALEILHNGIPLDLSQAYALFLGNDGLTLEQYLVYGHLTRLAYTVVRSKVGQRNTTTSQTSSSTLMSSTASNKRQLQVSYDVHLSNSAYSMTKNQRPDHRIIVMRAEEEMISVAEVRSLMSQFEDNVPINVATVDHGDIVYFSVDWVTVPDV